jgi:hypothetical protein
VDLAVLRNRIAWPIGSVVEEGTVARRRVVDRDEPARFAGRVNDERRRDGVEAEATAEGNDLLLEAVTLSRADDFRDLGRKRERRHGVGSGD